MYLNFAFFNLQYLGTPEAIYLMYLNFAILYLQYLGTREATYLMYLNFAILYLQYSGKPQKNGTSREMHLNFVIFLFTIFRYTTTTADRERCT